MTNSVEIALMVCVTVVFIVLLFRNILERLLESEQEDFSFSVKFWFFGIWYSRGAHKPPSEALPKVSLLRKKGVQDP